MIYIYTVINIPRASKYLLTSYFRHAPSGPVQRRCTGTAPAN